MMVLWMWLDWADQRPTPALIEADQKPIILLPYAATHGGDLLSDFAVIVVVFFN